LALLGAEEGKRIRAITPDALRLLTAFHWPGNIRQLENAMFRAVVLADGDSVGVDEFPQIAAQLSAGAQARAAGDQAVRHEGLGHEALGHKALEHEALADDPAETVPTAPALPSHPMIPPSSSIEALPLIDGKGDVRPLEEVEAELIRYAITHYRGQMSEVARRLQIGRSTLYRKLEALGLNAGATEPEAEGVAAERQPRKIA
jgi:DNA-binding NtrC family response regulator